MLRPMLRYAVLRRARAQTLWNSTQRQAMEVLGIILAGLLVLVEGADVVLWVRRTFLRRSLMTMGRTYRAPLYPIPGA